MEPGFATVTPAPDYGEPVRAWRLWEVDDLEGAPRLRSLYRSCFWPVRAAFEARCEAHKIRLWRKARHVAPAETCTCGVYGVPFASIRRFTARETVACARHGVALGDVVECERGWRAGFAYPDRLFVPLACSDAAAKAAGLVEYGVPVELLDTTSVGTALDEMERVTG